MTRAFLSVSVLFFTVLAFCPPAYAYIDAGTGSMIFQMLIAGALGAALGIKTFWWRIKQFFARKRTGEPREDE